MGSHPQLLWPVPEDHAGTSTADDIEDLLHRRTDLSTFLVHLTRDGGEPARSNLLSMLHARQIEARNVYGMMRSHASSNEPLANSQRSVCLSETPLEHAWMMCRRIEYRTYQFAPYGLAFPKVWARRVGANPVWYIDITPGHDWLTQPLNELIEIAAAGEAREFDGAGQGRTLRRVPFERSQIALIAPFLEQMGTGNDGHPYRKEFSWEREWRKVGPLSFNWSDVVAVFAPAEDHATFAAELRDLEVGRAHIEEPPPLLDPNWGLERMISALRGLPAPDLGPLP